jgi:hypothetical protein
MIRSPPAGSRVFLLDSADLPADASLGAYYIVQQRVHQP